MVDGKVHDNKQTIKPDLNEWHHVSSTFDGDMIRQYIDGELDVEWKPPGNEIFSVDVVFRIGKSQTGLAGTVCLVDEVAIYNRALSADEINQDMDKGVALCGRSPGGKLATTWANLKRVNQPHHCCFIFPILFYGGSQHPPLSHSNQC